MHTPSPHLGGAAGIGKTISTFLLPLLSLSIQATDRVAICTAYRGAHTILMHKKGGKQSLYLSITLWTGHGNILMQKAGGIFTFKNLQEMQRSVNNFKIE
jgi:hypothetical protein